MAVAPITGIGRPLVPRMPASQVGARRLDGDAAPVGRTAAPPTTQAAITGVTAPATLWPVAPIVRVAPRGVDTAYAAPVTAGSAEWPVLGALASAVHARTATPAVAPPAPARDVTPGMVLRAYAATASYR